MLIASQNTFFDRKYVLRNPSIPCPVSSSCQTNPYLLDAHPIRPSVCIRETGCSWSDIERWKRFELWAKTLSRETSVKYFPKRAWFWLEDSNTNIRARTFWELSLAGALNFRSFIMITSWWLLKDWIWNWCPVSWQSSSIHQNWLRLGMIDYNNCSERLSMKRCSNLVSTLRHEIVQYHVIWICIMICVDSPLRFFSFLCRASSIFQDALLNTRPRSSSTHCHSAATLKGLNYFMHLDFLQQIVIFVQPWHHDFQRFWLCLLLIRKSACCSR